MNLSDTYADLYNILPPERVRTNEPMSAHTSFMAGGPADIFFAPENAGELENVITACHDAGTLFYIIGNGTNVLVKDAGYRGAVITTKFMNSVGFADGDGRKIRAAGGASLSKVSNFALDNDLAGFEFASGIPGTMGGAGYMNAGAYGGEIKDSFDSALVLSSDGKTEHITNDGMEFEYRSSVLQKTRAIVIEATVCLVKDDYVKIKDRMLDFNKKREEKQPLDMPSAGSAFKRPLGNFASKLIEDAGLRGFRIGGAQVSEKHCGFIVNAGGATAADILALVARIQDEVFEKFGVALEPEFQIIGE